MYLLIVLLPLISAVSAGLFGRYIGREGSKYITTGSIMVTCALSYCAFYEVALLGQPCHFDLMTWIDSEMFSFNWGFLFDSLTVVMLVVVTSVSSLVHLYSTEYMGHDPHLPRFMSYLSLFTFFMLILVTADNFLQMFVGWEGVGLCSYLLINFWFARIQANKAAIKAMLVNRVGDFGLALGIFAIYLKFKSIDYAVVFAAAPAFVGDTMVFLNFEVDTLTCIGILLFVGAVGKSAQIGLHTWLPDAMEGPTPVSALIHAATINITKLVAQSWKGLVNFSLYAGNSNISDLTLLPTSLNGEGSFKPVLKYGQSAGNYNRNMKQEYFNSLGSSETIRETNFQSKFIQPRTHFLFEKYSQQLTFRQKKSFDRDPQFFEWFIGYYEGCCTTFRSTKRKGAAFIFQTRRADKELLKLIQSNLKFGSLRSGTKDDPMLYIATQRNQGKMLHLLNGNLCLTENREDLAALIEIYNKKNKIKIDYIPEGPSISLSTSWLAGYIAGKGEFNLYAYDINPDLSSIKFGLTFSDMSLESCFALQEVFPILKNQSDLVVNHELYNEFRLEDKEACLILLDYLSSHSLKSTSKIAIFTAWESLFHDFNRQDLPLTNTTVIPSLNGNSLLWEDILLKYLKTFQNIKENQKG